MNDRPSIQEIARHVRDILKQFDRNKILFLNAQNQLITPPVSREEKISHELLFQMIKLNDEELNLMVWSVFNPFFRDEDAWQITKKLHDMLYKGVSNKDSSTSFMITYEMLVWIINYGVININAHSFASEWDSEAQEIKSIYAKQLAELDQILNSFSSDQKYLQFVKKILEEAKKCSLRIVEHAIEIVAAGDKCEIAIHHLLAKIKDSEDYKDEAYSAIIDKLRPLMGIVTNTSPGLLFPCLDVLSNKNIEISSGIQYNATVTLSILQDSRSIDKLLYCLKNYSFYYTKIRENIIYTLGNLKEPKAVDEFIQILEKPDIAEVELKSAEGSIVRKTCSLVRQKEEIVWALGKIGLGAIKAIPVLITYADHSSEELLLYLSWALGEIGAAQKLYCGGLDVDIAITLLKLLKTKNKRLFEEAVSALRKIDIPEFTHSLYLYDIGAISILGLKPAHKALYELSETLHYLLSTKKRVIMAVNGDSGTGKTYFCHSIVQGFGDLKQNEILYLMRDRKQDQKIFDRMLGSEWLNKYVEASHYGDPSFPSNENPELFFTRFLQENQDKRLIILDGCRDESFFQRIIDLFYIHGELDVEVTFRATFSTRRLNLEGREIALESIKRHLDFLENPVLEDTQLYQEGVVILYDLNNSISCRLDEMEVKEVFEKKKIDSWGDLIRIGDFHQAPKSMKLSEDKLLYEEDEFTYRIETLPDAIIQPFMHHERKFKTVLNNDLTNQPNLLQIIEADDLKPQQIKFYAQDQIAGFGAESDVFVLSFNTNHIFFTSFAGIAGMTLRGRDIFLIDSSCELKQISFERNQLASFGKTDSPASSITSFLRNKIATGHYDGTVRVWDFAESKLNTFHAHSSPVTSLAVDYKGCIYSGSLDNSFKKWDMESRKVNILHGSWSKIPAIKLYPGGKILMLSEELTSPDKIHILDFKNAQHRVVYSAFEENISAINVYFDGRIVAALQPLNTNDRKHKNNLLVIAPSKDECSYKQIDGHVAKTIDCFTMGPKIISCGIENDDIHTLRIWGTEFYVDMELRKLRLQPF